MDAERAAASHTAHMPGEKRRSAAIEALSRRTSITAPPAGMLAMIEEGDSQGYPKEVKRSAAVMALMQRKTLLNDQTHEQIGLVNGHLVRAGDTTHHQSDDEGGRNSTSRFDPEVSLRLS